MFDKKNYVKKLSDFYIKEARNPEGIDALRYVETEEGERVYVIYHHGQKRFSVDADNGQGILLDFAKYLSNTEAYHWLPSNLKINPEILEMEDRIEELEDKIFLIKMKDTLNVGDDWNINMYNRKIVEYRNQIKSLKGEE